jgi:hypothetical protein
VDRVMLLFPSLLPFLAMSASAIVSGIRLGGSNFGKIA